MEVKFEKNAVVIRVPVTKESVGKAALSKSGKTKLVASTGGFSAVPEAPFGLKLSMNLIADKDAG